MSLAKHLEAQFKLKITKYYMLDDYYSHVGKAHSFFLISNLHGFKETGSKISHMQPV